MKQSFEAFLSDHRKMINQNIMFFKPYKGRNGLHTIEDYKRVGEMVLYDIWKNDRFINEENREGFIFWEIKSNFQNIHQRDFKTKKAKLYNEAERLNKESKNEEDNRSNIDYIEDENSRIKSFEYDGFWELVRSILKKEKHVDLYVAYYKSGLTNLTDFYREIKPNMKYEAMRRFFKKYEKILSENRGKFIDYKC